MEEAIGRHASPRQRYISQVSSRFVFMGASFLWISRAVYLNIFQLPPKFQHSGSLRASHKLDYMLISPSLLFCTEGFVPGMRVLSL
jgi:hypothetical protein